MVAYFFSDRFYKYAKYPDFFIILQAMIGEKGKQYLAITEDGKHLKLKSGDLLPLVGFGTWKLAANHCEQSIYQAIKSGYRHIDCAALYGNQAQIGRGIKKALDQKIVTRKELFITTKLWVTFRKPEHVREGFNRSLSDLGLEYIDLYLIHNPTALKYVDPKVAYPTLFEYVPTPTEGPKIIVEKVPIIDTWRVMEQLVEEGLIRNIGVSNFSISLLRDLMDGAKIQPAVNQVQIHPYLTQKRLINYCQKHGVQVTSYSTFGGASYVELNFALTEQPIVETNVVKTIAEAHKKTCSQIILRWAVQQGLSIIPKTSKAERLLENQDVTSWSLTEQEMSQIDSLNINKRYCEPANFIGEEAALDIAWD